MPAQLIFHTGSIVWDNEVSTGVALGHFGVSSDKYQEPPPLWYSTFGATTLFHFSITRPTGNNILGAIALFNSSFFLVIIAANLLGKWLHIKTGRCHSK